MLRDSAQVRLERRARQSASGAAASLVAFALVMAPQSMGWLTIPELKLYDYFVQWRAQPADPKNPLRIAYITPNVLKDAKDDRITEKTLATGLQQIVNRAPLVIGLDVLPQSPDKELQDIINNNQVIVVETPNYFQSKIEDNGKGCESLQKVNNPATPEGIHKDLLGFDDYPVDPDCVIRRAAMYQSAEGIRGNGPVEYSFPYLVAGIELENASPPSFASLGGSFEIGSHKTRLSRLPADSGGYRGVDTNGFQFLIDFREQAGAFPSCDLDRLDDCGNLQNAVVLVGYRGGDSHRTALGGEIPGVELHAHVVSQLIRMGMGQSRQVEAAKAQLGDGWILLAALAASTYATVFRSKQKFGWGLALNVILILLAGGLALGYGDLWLPSFGAALAVVLAANLARLLSRRWLRIFLNYAREDADMVAHVYACLRALGHDPWIDKDGLLGGDNYPQRLAAAIRQSDRFLACLSHSSLEKAQRAEGILAKEIQQALDIWGGRLDPEGLVPVRLEPCEMPAQLKQLHWVDFFEKAGPKDLRKALHSR